MVRFQLPKSRMKLLAIVIGFAMMILALAMQFDLYGLAGSTLQALRAGESRKNFFGQLNVRDIFSIFGRKGELQDALSGQNKTAAVVPAPKDSTLDTLKRIQVSPRKKGLVVGYRFGAEPSDEPTGNEP